MAGVDSVGGFMRFNAVERQALNLSFIDGMQQRGSQQSNGIDVCKQGPSLGLCERKGKEWPRNGQMESTATGPKRSCGFRKILQGCCKMGRNSKNTVAHIDLSSHVGSLGWVVLPPRSHLETMF